MQSDRAFEGVRKGESLHSNCLFETRDQIKITSLLFSMMVFDLMCDVTVEISEGGEFFKILRNFIL